MARRIRFTAASRRLFDESRPPLEYHATASGIVIKGGLSVTGSAEWLQVEAHRHYRTLTVSVLCRMEPLQEKAPEVQDYAYDIEVPDVAAGRYLLRVRHSVVGAGGVGFGITVLEEEMEVPEEGVRLRPQRYTGVRRVVHRNLSPTGHSEN